MEVDILGDFSHSSLRAISASMLNGARREELQVKEVGLDSRRLMGILSFFTP
jgi:hypothetical protein